MVLTYTSSEWVFAPIEKIFLFYDKHSTLLQFNTKNETIINRIYFYKIWKVLFSIKFVWLGNILSSFVRFRLDLLVVVHHYLTYALTNSQPNIRLDLVVVLLPMISSPLKIQLNKKIISIQNTRSRYSGYLKGVVLQFGQCIASLELMINLFFFSWAQAYYHSWLLFVKLAELF